MKTILLAIAALVVSSTSHAVIADRFKCTLELKDLGSQISTKEDKDFFIARLPLSPEENVRLTASQATETLTLQTPKAELTANLNFYYKHAVKIDANGNPLEARQMTCIGLTGDYCEKSRSGDANIGTCSTSMIACLEAEDPFDPNSGWSPTGLIGGRPTFNEQTLGPATTMIDDDNGNIVGSVNLDCRYMGSFQ